MDRKPGEHTVAPIAAEIFSDFEVRNGDSYIGYDDLCNSNYGFNHAGTDYKNVDEWIQSLQKAVKVNEDAK